jgi:hypothetical protein
MARSRQQAGGAVHPPRRGSKPNQAFCHRLCPAIPVVCDRARCHVFVCNDVRVLGPVANRLAQNPCTMRSGARSISLKANGPPRWSISPGGIVVDSVPATDEHGARNARPLEKRWRTCAGHGSERVGTRRPKRAQKASARLTVALIVSSDSNAGARTGYRSGRAVSGEPDRRRPRLSAFMNVLTPTLRA